MTGRVSVTVMDNDGSVISIAAVTSPVTEGTAAMFTLTATPAPTADLTVTVSVDDGAGDFIDGPAPTTVMIAANATTATLTVRTIDDGVDEDDGMITVMVEDRDNYRVADPSGNTANVEVRDDDDTTITGATTGMVTEDDATNTERGMLTLSLGLFTAQAGGPGRADGQGAYGSFTLTDTGAWTYTLNNADPATNALAGGVQVTDVFTAVAADNSVTQDVTITVIGANDAPTANAGADQPAVLVGTTVTLEGRGTDPDTGDSIVAYTWTQSTGPTVILSDATVARPTFPAPLVTSATALTFALVVSDGEADSPADTVTITVSPGITGNTTGAVTEDATVTTATGLLDNPIGDFEAQTGATDRANGQGAYGNFTLAATGAWTYTLDNTPGDDQGDATNALPAGATRSDIFTAVSSANAGVMQAVTITVTGANDAPTAEAGNPQTVPREATVELIGNGTDPDTGDQAELTYAWTQTGGTSTVTLVPGVASNRVTFTAPTVTTDTTLTFTLTVTDRQGAADTATVMVTINTGSMASDITGDIFGLVTEDAAPNTATGALTVTDAGGDHAQCRGTDRGRPLRHLHAGRLAVSGSTC